jgi:anti-anti-sigma regulatory factor
MELTIKQGWADGEEKKVIITLAGGATIGEVGKIKEALLAAFADCTKLLLDVGDITGADPALLQLIHAARRTAENEGKKFVLVGEFSAVFQDAALSSGFLPEDNDENESAWALWKE